MRLLLGRAVTLLASQMSACGGGGDRAAESEATVTVTAMPTPASVTTSARTGETPGWKVAVTQWADRMADHNLDALTTAPGLAEQMDLNDTEVATSEVTALCSGSVTEPILKANAKMALANFKLSLCGLNPDQTAFGPTCPKDLAREIRTIAQKVAPLIGAARSHV